MDKDPIRRPIWKSLYSQVITAIVIGVILGSFWPQLGETMKPLGDGFVKLIKMIIAPIIFCTVVVGIAGMEDMKKVGKTGGLALLYFEIVSSIALVIGLVIINVVQPGRRHERRRQSARYQGHRRLHRAGQDAGHRRVPARHHPDQVVDAFAKGEILQVLLFAVLFGFALHKFGGRGTLVFDVIEKTSHVLFGIVGMIMKVAPHRRVRRDGIHGRQVRRRLARFARLSDGHVLRSPASLHLRRARADRAVPRLLDLQVRSLHQGRAADRARHLELGIGAAAHDGEDGEPRRARNRSSASSFPPATRSTSTAPRST